LDGRPTLHEQGEVDVDETEIVSRMVVLIAAWLAMVALTVLAIGLERKHAWFRQRDLSKSFLNRRGFLGEFIHLGYPCTREGWLIWTIFMTVIVISTYFTLFA